MFTDEERRIFAYHDGVSDRYGDPLALNRALLVALGGDVQEAIDAAYRPTGETDGSLLRLLVVLREVFVLPAFDPKTGQGVTDAMVLHVLWEFAEFMNQKKTPFGS